MTPPPQLDELLRTAHGDLQFGMVAEAAHHLRQAASLAPDDPRIDLMLASAAAGRDDHAGVLTAIDRAIAKGLEPPPPIRFARIHALYTLGRIDEALAGIDAEGMAAMGPLMGKLKPQLQGRADMGEVSQRVKAKLGT